MTESKKLILLKQLFLYSKEIYFLVDTRWQFESLSYTTDLYLFVCACPGDTLHPELNEFQ